MVVVIVLMVGCDVAMVVMVVVVMMVMALINYMLL
jgi:hypothetical protein